MEAANWRNRIHANPEILSGKPTVHGTRLSVEFILSLFSSGWSTEQVLQNYPQLSPDDLAAVFSYAAECVQDHRLFTIDVDVA
jgi:uncharacterized protein (DUF433 family)